MQKLMGIVLAITVVFALTACQSAAQDIENPDSSSSVAGSSAGSSADSMPAVPEPPAVEGTCAAIIGCPSLAEELPIKEDLQ